MARSDIGRFGMSVEVRDRDALRRDAVHLEELGYSTIWLPGGQLATLDPVAEAIRATRAIKVGSGIIAADRYDAATVAATYAGIESTDPGRFIVGLGGAHGPRPLRVLNSYLDDLDASSPPVPASARVLAALGPRMLELARDRAAGALPLLVTPEYTAAARARLGSGTQLIITQFVVLDPDPDRAREAARRPLGFLSKIDGYARNFRRMGFTEREVSQLDDRLVDALIAWGGVDTVADRITEHLDAGADQVAMTVLLTALEPGPSHAWSALADRLIG